MLTPARAWIVGAAVVLVVGWMVLNPVRRPVKIGSDAVATTSTAEASPDEVLEWSDEWAGQEWATPTVEPDATSVPGSTGTDVHHDSWTDDVTVDAEPVITDFLTTYYTPPPGDIPTDAWLDKLRPLATPLLMDGMVSVDPRLIPPGEPGDLEWVRVAGSFTQATFLDPSGQLVSVEATNVGDGWQVRTIEPAGELQLAQ